MGAWLVATLLGCGGVLSRVAPPPAPAAATVAPGVPARARLHVLLGHLALEAGDRAAAEVAFQTALLHDPGSPWIWLALADVARRADDIDTERRRVREAVRLGPEVPEAWTRLGALAERTGDLGAAIDAYEAALAHGAGSEAYAPLGRLLVARQDPRGAAVVSAWSGLPLVDLPALRERGRLRLLVADLPGAVADLGEALVRSPSEARLLDEYVTAVTGSGLLRTGLARLVVLHHLVPRDADVLLRTYHLAVTARDHVRAADALEALDGVLDGRDAQVKLWLAEAYSALGRHADASRLLDAAVRCRPPVADLGYHRARLLRAAGRSADALRQLEVPDAGANRAAAQSLRAWLLLDAGRPADARAGLDEALRTLPDDYQLLGALVATGAAAGDRAAMLAAVDRMTMLAPDARARTRARSLAGRGDVDAALAALRDAGLGEPESWVVAGALLREAGRADDAADWLTRGVARFPGHAALHVELGLAEEARRRDDAARTAVREAIRLDPTDSRAVRWYVRTVPLEGAAARLEARGWILAALERSPADAELLVALGRVEQASGSPLRAVAAYEEARRYGSADPALLASLADAYRAAGHDAQAHELEERPRP